MTKPVFTACSDMLNCVSSMEIGTRHYVEPLRYQGRTEEAKKRLLTVISGFNRTQVLESSGSYIRATFTSFLFRFTDDVELQIDEKTKLIHIKSKSRIGYFDFGANRRRCEAIRDRFDR